jgi:hypothetical protein
MNDPLNPLDVVNEIYTNHEPSIDFVKMQVAFWEKLVVLDAATLAASFTAIGAFHDRLAGDGGIGYLAAAWKLLICGLALCLLAQWIAIPGAIAIAGYYGGMRVLSLLNKSAGQASARGEQQSPENLTLSSEIVTKSPGLRWRGNFYSRLAGGLGSTGLLASIAALYWLYRFAHVNISNLRR